jgi:hypothetical protein
MVMQKDSIKTGFELTTMSTKKGYFTIRLSKFYEDMIDNYLEIHREDARFGGQRMSRATVVRLALEDFFKKEGIIQVTALDSPPDYLKLGRELIFTHAIVKLAQGEQLPSDHKNTANLTTYLRQLVEKQELEKSVTMNDAQREAIVEELLQYHQQLLEMIAAGN